MDKKMIAKAALAVVGAFFLLAPHSVHTGLGLTTAHVYHMGFGVLLLAGAGYLHFKK